VLYTSVGSQHVFTLCHPRLVSLTAIVSNGTIRSVISD